MHKIDIVDDSQMFSVSLGNLLKLVSGKFTLGKIWNTAPEFLLHLKSKNTVPPDLVLIDYRMPFLRGGHLSYILQRDYPTIKKIGISADAEPAWIDEFLATGCRAFIDKASHPTELQVAIETVLKDKYYENLYVEKNQIKKYNEKTIEYNFPFGLSDNEYLYIQLCQSPLTNDAIASVLGIGKELLHKKQQKLFKQFNVKSRAELVNFAIEKKIIKMFMFNN